MGVYDSLINTADRLIRTKGKATKLYRSAVTVTSETSDTDTVVEAEHDIKAVGIPPGRSAEWRIGSLANRKIMEFYISAKGLVIDPQNGDEVLWLGIRYKLIWTSVLNPNADASIFTQAYGETT